MLLETQDVSKAFGGFVALAEATLTVEAGEIVGLIGPNGAGKSTFFNCIAGDLAPSGGRIRFDGVDVTHEPPEARALLGIGRTFQVPATFEDMSILENVMVGAFLRHPHARDARAKATEVLRLTGLETQAAQPRRRRGPPGAQAKRRSTGQPSRTRRWASGREPTSRAAWSTSPTTGRSWKGPRPWPGGSAGGSWTRRSRGAGASRTTYRGWTR